MLVKNKDYHIPVLLKPSVDELVQDVGGIYVDVTYGGGDECGRLRNDGGSSYYTFDITFYLGSGLFGCLAL